MCLTVGLLLLATPPVWAHHVVGIYEGTDAQGARVGFEVKGTGSYLGGFGASTSGKTDAGQDCSPLYPPLNNAADIVDHAFSNTISATWGGITFSLTINGSFSAPQSASGTVRVTSDSWMAPPGQPPLGATCDTGTVRWTATCVQKEAPPSFCSKPPEDSAATFSGSASGARTTRDGRVTLPLRIGCPPPGVDCRVSVAATARVRASAAARRKLVKLGRSHYLIKVGKSAKTRFRLNAKGRRLLRRLGRINAKVELAVTRASSVTRKNVTVRLKAPRRAR
jgi:hypothetical protein